MKKIALMAMVLGGLLFVSGSIGYSLGTRQVKEPVTTQIIGDSKEVTQAVTDFLTAYYTFDTYGDNLSSYEGYLTETQLTNEKEQIALTKAGTQPQQFGHSKYQTSSVYVNNQNKDQIEVIASVTHTISLVDHEGNVVTEGITNHPVLTISLERQGDQYKISHVAPLNLTNEEA